VAKQFRRGSLLFGPPVLSGGTKLGRDGNRRWNFRGATAERLLTQPASLARGALPK